MERPLPYLLIVLLLIGGWNETFKSRFDRLTGRSEEKSTEKVAAESPAPTPKPVSAAVQRLTPRPTPRYTAPTAAPAVQSTGGAFFNDPGYHTTLDRGAPKKGL